MLYLRVAPREQVFKPLIHSKGIGFFEGAPMATQRAQDTVQTTHFRSDRISTINGRFFFTTREGTLEGPYFSRDEAERGIPRYIDRMMQSLAILDSRNAEDVFRP